MQATGNYVLVRPGGSDSASRLLLEDVKHVDRLGEPNCIHCTKCIASMIFNYFEDTRSIALPWFGMTVLFAKLRDTQCIADV
jgi:hypothetical protein